MNAEIKIRDEEILLLGLCRLEFSDEQRTKLQVLASKNIDWSLFSTLANNHGVAALVYHNLEKLKLIALVTEEVTGYLRGTLLRSLSRNTFHAEMMSGVLQLLNTHGIKTVLLKGLALEQTVYGNIGLRQMSDVDILIRKDECIEARAILINSGFVSLPVKSFFHKKILAHYGKHLPTLIKNGGSVEIHHELFGGKKNVLTTMLYESSYPVDLKGEKCYIPQYQIFFLYLIKHLYLHELNNESQLRLYTDLVVLLEKHYDKIINYDLLKYATDANMSEILAWRLEPLRDLWGIRFPDWIDEFINKCYNPDSINKFIFFLNNPKDNPPINKPGFYRHLVRDIPGLHRKILFLMGDIFPTVSFMKKRYKCKSTLKVILYYPHRMGKILWLFRR